MYIPFEGYYESKGGRIESPKFDLDKSVEENAWYELKFEAKSPVDGYWWVDVFDRDGNPMPDMNSRLYASEDWKTYGVVVPVQPGAVKAQIAFVTRKGVQVRNVSVRKLTVKEAADWCRKFYATLPQVDLSIPSDAWDKLPRSKQLLKENKPIRVVLLGDSIVNDTWCGNVSALVLERFPNMRMIVSVRGSTGCWYYRDPKHFEEYVLRHKPDLLLIGGISNGKAFADFSTAEADMVETINLAKKAGIEVGVMSPPPSYEFRRSVDDRTWDENVRIELWDDYAKRNNCWEPMRRDYQRRAVAKTDVAYFDLTTAPADAILRSKKPLNWFKRDPAHNDDRGKQLIAQRLAAFFFAAAEEPAVGDLESACWFYAGFDAPIRLAGGCFPGKLVDAGYREGKFGRGYYFHSPTENVLPPMAEFLSSATNFVVKEGKLSVGKTLKCSGGTFTTVPRHVEIRNSHPWVTTQTGYTGSFYVKGPKDAELTVRMDLAPLSTNDIAKIDKRCSKGGDWHKLKDDPLRPDISSNKVWKLTGDWQRVYAYALLDNRERPVGRDVSLSVTCAAPVEMKDFQFQQTGEYPRQGQYNPMVYTDGGTKTRIPELMTEDSVFTSGFPVSEGSFVAWIKCFKDDAGAVHNMPLWGFAYPWKQNWGFNGRSMRVNGRQECFYEDWNKYALPYEWRHYAATWKDGTVKLYIDGRLLESRTMKGLSFDAMSQENGRYFHFGSRSSGDGAPDALVDEVAIFSAALSDGEIASIAKSDKPLFDGSTRMLADPVGFTTFFRNQKDAALRTPLYSFVAGIYTVEAKIGDETLKPFKLELGKGEGKLVIPFDPAIFPVGRYAWEFRVTGPDGRTALARKGELEIKGRLERDAFRIMSWGGSKNVHNDFLRTCGINAVNCNNRSNVRNALNDGFFTNIRYENHKGIVDADYDYAKLASKATVDLGYAEGLHTWVSTLVNSEVYGVGSAHTATNHPTFCRMAEQELGFKPEWSIDKNIAGVNYKQLGEKCPQGIVDGMHPTFRTLAWYMDSGMPYYRLNGETRKEIHKLSPDNTVWTEPIMPPGGMGNYVDMMADWIYEYSPSMTLAQLRGMAGMMRGVNKPFVPTLGFNYWPEQKGTNPAVPDTKTKTDMGQSCDENMIKGWMSIGAVKASHLHIFAADSWEYGVSNALAWTKDRTVNVPQICEPDAPRRFGEFVRQTLEPAAYLLRDIDNVRAPVAFMLSAEADYASFFGWDTYWYPRRLTDMLCKLGIPCDILHEHEINAEILSRYRYVIFPMSRIVTKAHDEEFRKAAAKGTVFVLDSYATFTYPNAVQLPMKTGPANKDSSFRQPFKDWYTNQVDTLRAELPAWSDMDFTKDVDSYTFTKEYEGVKYITVVNNRRRAGGSILTEFKTNEWYKPIGAPCRITTHIKRGGNETVYRFQHGKVKAEKTGGYFEIADDFAAAEGRVYVVYPRALDEIELKLGGEFAAGKTAWVEVGVLDESGKIAPGRQVIELTLTAPDGTTRDESGIYAVHGKTRIPLRFAKGEQSGGMFRKWKVSVRELTSGLEESEKFTLNK